MPELQIGNVKLENDLILGPMAGVTDLPFRLLCKKSREQGCSAWRWSVRRELCITTKIRNSF